MGGGCTKDAKAGVVDLQNGDMPATPRSSPKTNVKIEGDFLTILVGSNFEITSYV